MWLIYEVKLSLCDAIYMGNTHQKFKKIMDGRFYEYPTSSQNG